MIIFFNLSIHLQAKMSLMHTIIQIDIVLKLTAISSHSIMHRYKRERERGITNREH